MPPGTPLHVRQRREAMIEETRRNWEKQQIALRVEAEKRAKDEADRIWADASRAARIEAKERRASKESLVVTAQPTSTTTAAAAPVLVVNKQLDFESVSVRGRGWDFLLALLLCRSSGRGVPKLLHFFLLILQLLSCESTSKLVFLHCQYPALVSMASISLTAFLRTHQKEQNTVLVPEPHSMCRDVMEIVKTLCFKPFCGETATA